MSTLLKFKEQKALSIKAKIRGKIRNMKSILKFQGFKKFCSITDHVTRQT